MPTIGFLRSTPAEPFEFVASGTVDGVPFSDEPLTFAGVTDTGTVAAIAQANLPELAQLIAALAYVGGLGLVIASIVEFKKHKQNPQLNGFAVEASFASPLTSTRRP